MCACVCLSVIINIRSYYKPSGRHQTNGCVMVRSSQPLVGVLGWRSPDDERLLLAYSQSCALTSVQQANEAKQNGGPTACMASNLTSNNVKKWGVASLLRDESDEFFSDSDEEGVPHYDSEDDVRGLPKLKVFDLRSYTAALGNRAKGGGCECTGVCVCVCVCVFVCACTVLSYM